MLVYKIKFLKLNPNYQLNLDHSSNSSFSSNSLFDSLITTGTEMAGIFPNSHTIYIYKILKVNKMYHCNKLILSQVVSKV